MGSVAIMTYSWRTLSYWPDKQYWLIEEAAMLSWQPEVMVGGNRAGDGEGCSLSFELYCCYRFPIRKKDGPLYWPTTSMKVCLNHTSKGHLPPVHFIIRYSAAVPLCVCVCLACVTTCTPAFLVHPHLRTCVFCRDRIVCEMAAAPKGSAPGPVKLCVGECRPELRAQSSQLYSFVVIPTLKHINFVHLLWNKHQVFAMNEAELN